MRRGELKDAVLAIFLFREWTTRRRNVVGTDEAQRGRLEESIGSCD
jgi:hypothetical protein